MENRNHRRELYLQQINYVPVDGPMSQTLIGSTINISNSGVCILAFDRLTEGQEIEITLGLPESNPLQKCTVRWVREINKSLYKAGLMFSDFPSSRAEEYA